MDKEKEKLSSQLARQLRIWRERRRSSRRVLAGFAGLSHPVVGSAERGANLRLYTWEKLFDALGCELAVTVEEGHYGEECEEYLVHETDRRYWRRVEWLNRRLHRR